jgi:broad specificity phosphatase PhoE
MGRLVLVRHGQASFLDGDYDRLSTIGETQARILGAFWARQNTKFDLIFTGPRNRQIRTAELTAEAYRNQGPSLPQCEVIPHLDEYDSGGIMDELAVALARKEPEVHSLIQRFEQSRGGSEQPRAFQQLFETVMKEWISDGVTHPGVETWGSFATRVREALSIMVEGQSGGKRIAVFTSGGPISVAMQAALGVSNLTALELNWQIRNCSLTEFLFSRGRFTLHSFNSLPHLTDQSLWTYR